MLDGVELNKYFENTKRLNVELAIPECILIGEVSDPIKLLYDSRKY